MLAYLLVLYDPDPPPFIGIEEPENHLHPRLLPGLAEECRSATEHSQLFVTTHAPFFLNALRPNEVRVLYRDERGYTQARRTADMRGIREFMEEGATLGDLWMEGHFDVGDPLVDSGGPKRSLAQRRR
jgi:predicted ATPase